ncbi:hypothetical protein K5L01_04935 [Stenotrophomonas sp. CPCC 101365]|uniref:Arginase family protein n=1 Tax=Stenotrophomonas mori TaxID=2871096 RepID=A0ABT0SFB7_9GAMM|nr:hypothetical protein [Stenotrophomonas mori]
MAGSARPPVVLDLDGSVLPLGGERVLALGEWQEELRFACSRASMRRFSALLDARLPARHGPVLTGSGDFHHLSYPLLRRLRAPEPYQLIVLDNHPDNMRYPLGIHCGSWVSWAAALPQVSHVHVLGITSHDIGSLHAWENRWRPLLSGKLTYWSMGVPVRWARWLGLGRGFRSFDSPSALVDAFIDTQRRQPQPAYLSIDKDVFAEEVARTNWDQGRFRLGHALAVIHAAHEGGLVGSDITGEVSQYRYRSRLKRLLSALDGQPQIPGRTLHAWQAQQREVNRVLLSALAEVPVREVR